MELHTFMHLHAFNHDLEIHACNHHLQDESEGLGLEKQLSSITSLLGCIIVDYC